MCVKSFTFFTGILFLRNPFIDIVHMGGSFSDSVFLNSKTMLIILQRKQPINQEAHKYFITPTIMTPIKRVFYRLVFMETFCDNSFYKYFVLRPHMRMLFWKLIFTDMAL